MGVSAPPASAVAPDSDDIGSVDDAGGDDAVAGSGRAQTRGRRSPRSRNWVFTDYTLDDFRQQFFDVSNQFRYLCFGKELCPKTQREHHQGWLQFKDHVPLSTCKGRLGVPSVHLEIMRGSCDESERYVTKDGRVTRYGRFVCMGQRTDIDEVRVAISEGGSGLEVADSNFPLWCRFRQSFQTYRFLCLKKKYQREYRPITVILLEGRTRCGKTRLATKYGSFIIGGYQLKWWDGYDGEDCIIIDDFANDVPIQQMLRVLDGNFLRLPVKGSFSVAAWTRVIITTNLVSLYDQAPNEHLDALRARITRVISAFGPDEVMPNSIEEFERLDVLSALEMCDDLV